MTETTSPIVPMIEHARMMRETLLADAHRPKYHFAIPEDIGIPGDPNGAFYANGRYHLMYLYACRSDGFRWGHLSSHDLVHWQWHPDAVLPDELDGGIFSGGAFLDENGTCYLTYWGLPVGEGQHGGIRIIKSCDAQYNTWEKFAEYALECTENGVFETIDANGKPRYLGCADPSNIWKKDGYYYMQTGNLCVLIKFKHDGLHEYTSADIESVVRPAEIAGDWVDLFRSRDLHNWEYLHRFYTREADNSLTGTNEDDMCPSFLPLASSKEGGEFSGKYLQLFISHNRGCQYYIGVYDEEKDLFLPETHGRMSWEDNTFFAPEALLDNKGRQIMWAWLADNRADELELGWSGVFGLPRVLWLRADGALGIAPVPELEQLRYNQVSMGAITLTSTPQPVTGINGLSCEIKLCATVPADGEFGLYLRANADLIEYTKIGYDAKNQQIFFDATHSGTQGRPIIEYAPFVLEEGEALELTIFIDHSVIEIYANERQAICRRVYPDAAGEQVLLYGTCGVQLDDLVVYEMAAANLV